MTAGEKNMFQNWETFIGIVVVLAILLPIILKKLY